MSQGGEYEKIIYFEEIGLPKETFLAIKKFKQAGQSILPHMHKDTFEIVFHVSGKQTYILQDKEYLVRGGDVFVTFPNEWHGTGSWIEEKSKFYYINFCMAPSINSFLGLSKEDENMIRQMLLGIKNRHFKGTQKLIQLMDEIFDEWDGKSPLRKIRMNYLLIELLYQVVHLEKVVEQKVPCDIQQVLQYIEEHDKEIQSLQELADEINLSLPRFKQKFKSYIGVPPFEYLLQTKLKHAEKLLKNKEYSITDIALEFNFSSTQHFSMLFKKMYGITPTQYRKSTGLA